MRTVVGFSTLPFTPPPLGAGAAGAAGASAMIPPSLMIRSSGRLRGRAGVDGTMRALREGGESRFVAARAGAEVALGPHRQVDHQADDAEEEDQDRPEDGVGVSARGRVLEGPDHEEDLHDKVDDAGDDAEDAGDAAGRGGGRGFLLVVLEDLVDFLFEVLFALPLRFLAGLALLRR